MREITGEDDLANFLRIRERVLVLFYASWCPFCRNFLPIFEEHSRGSRAEYLGVRIDDDENPLWEKYDVTVVPTVILVEEGRVLRRLDGILGTGLREKQFKEFLHDAQAKTIKKR